MLKEQLQARFEQLLPQMTTLPPWDSLALLRPSC
jgi:hypothetical protein